MDTSMDTPEKQVEKSEMEESHAVKEATKEPSPSPKKPGFWTRLLRWLLSFLIIFGLGALAVLVLVYIPARQELDQTRQQLNAIATQSSSELQGVNEEIERLSAVETSNKDLQAQLDQANLLVVLQQIRLDIANAQLALANEDTARAKLALSTTAQTIKKLENLLPQAQQDAIASLEARLKLILEELEDNTYAANSDLNVMANTLLELENALKR